LAEDLRRFQAGEPILARPVRAIERAVRWAWRRPAAAALLAVSAVTLLALVGLIVGLINNTQLREEKDRTESALNDVKEARNAEATARAEAEEQRRKAEAALGVAEAANKVADRIGYFHSVFLADMALKERNVPLAQQRLQECKPALRNWEWRYLNARCHPELFAVHGHIAVFSPDGARIAVTSFDINDGAMRVYDARTGAEVLALKGPQGLHNPVFSPDGTRIAAQCSDVVRVYDARTKAEVLTLQGPAPLFAPVFSPDGMWIAAGGNDKQVRVFDAQTGAERFALQGPQGVHNPAFSPVGSRIAVAPWPDSDGVVRVYDARTGTAAFAAKGPAPLSHTAFSPDGTRIVAGGKDGVIRVYDVRTGTESFVIKGPVPLSILVFSPDGARIAAWGNDSVMRVYDARTGAETFALRGPRGLPVFSPDGSRMMAGSDDGVVRVYDARTGAEIRALQGPPGLHTPMFSSDGTRIAVRPALVGGDGLVRVYDARMDAEALTLKGPPGLHSPTFSPDMAWIAAGSDDGVVRLYDVRTRAETLALKGPRGLGSPVFSPDGTRIAVAPAFRNGDGVVRMYDARTGAEILALQGSQGFVGRPVFRPDGMLIATDSSGVVRVYDARTGIELLALKRPVGIGMPAFSPDGTRIAANVQDIVRVYDTRTGAEILTLKGGQGLAAPVFSPDGTQIAVAPWPGGDGVVRVYDARTGAEVLALKGPQGLSVPVFSPDGARIAAAPFHGDNVVRVYDARTGAEVLALKGPAGESLNFAFSSDGARIAVAALLTGRDGIVVRVYDAPHDTTAWQAERRQALVDGLPTWHRNKAVEGDRAGQWFASAFHWGRLALAEPASGQPHFRRGLALVHLARTAEAKTEFETALALKKGLGPYHLAEAYARLGQWDKVPDATGLMALTRFATHQERRFVATAGLYQEGFRAHPEWEDARVPPQPNGVPFTNRRFAASAAAMADAGEGDGAPLTDEQRAGWRRQALDWLRAELEVWKQSLDEATPQEAGVIAKLLADVQADGWLVSVRDAARLARLPETERDTFRKFWDDVAALLKKAQTKKE
jgi:WD40 repeat protein